MEPVSLHCLGVGDGAASTGRNHSAYLYAFGETRLLIDCGEPVGRSLHMAGLGPDAVDAILISHLHSDHIGGLFMLLQGLWIEQRKKRLPIRMPGGAIDPVRTMIRTVYLFDEILPFELVFEPITAGQAITLGSNVKVTPFHTTHLQWTRKKFEAKYRGEYAAYSFLMESDSFRIAHSADIGAVTDLEPLLSAPVDLLVCEVSHIEPEALFAYLRGRRIKKVVLTHVHRDWWHNRLDEIRAQATRELTGMDVAFAQDGGDFRF